MRIQTLSIVAGSEACNARCPFCISKMTPPHGVELREPETNWRNFRVACRLAARTGVTTAMLTGKGEPTLFPGQIGRYLEELAAFDFPFVELQTNGLLFRDKPDEYDVHLKRWYELGLTTIAVSIGHWEEEKNRALYTPYRERYGDLAGLVTRLHGHGFTVRLTVVMMKGYVEDPVSLRGLVDFARQVGAEQLSVRPLFMPDKSRSDEVAVWSAAHALDAAAVDAIRRYLAESAVPLMTLPHGALIYDLDGQNVCLTDCMTLESRADDLRYIIFFPNGRLRYDWRYPGAVLL